MSRNSVYYQISKNGLVHVGKPYFLAILNFPPYISKYVDIKTNTKLQKKTPPRKESLGHLTWIYI